jgi:hypothetical protein
MAETVSELTLDILGSMVSVCVVHHMDLSLLAIFKSTRFNTTVLLATAFSPAQVTSTLYGKIQ